MRVNRGLGKVSTRGGLKIEARKHGRRGDDVEGAAVLAGTARMNDAEREWEMQGRSFSPSTSEVNIKPLLIGLSSGSLLLVPSL